MSLPHTPVGFMALFAEFRAPSWDAWRGVLARLQATVRELWVIAGRGSGKSRIAALIADTFAMRDYPRAPGESIYIGIFGPDRKQAGVTFRYLLGLLRSEPELAALIANDTKESVELKNGVTIEVITASTAAPRGRSYAVVIVEEASFLPTDESANPDVELLRAIRPALARVRGSLLCVIGSPYARRGVMWEAYRRHHGQPDGAVVFVQAPTREMNPCFDLAEIERAYEEDPASAAAEYGAQFRADVESFVSQEAVDAVVVPGRLELPRVVDVSYFGALDFAGGAGGGDSATLAISHAEKRDGRAIAVLDLVREVRPPFSPEEVCASFATTLKDYGITTATADRWAGQFPVEQMAKHGVLMTPCPKAKSDVYRESLLPVVNSRGCELLEHPRLLAQLVGLERRTARGGRDSVDHAPGGRDDVINSASIALMLASSAAAVPTIGFGPEIEMHIPNPRPAYGPPASDVDDEDEDGGRGREDLVFGTRRRHAVGWDPRRA